MNLIISPRSGNRLYSVRVRSAKHYLVWITCLLTIVLTIACGGYWLGLVYGNKSVISQWKQDVHEQQSLLVEVQQQSDANFQALTQKMAYFQAHISRLEALGGKLMAMAELDDDQIDFTQEPGFGGPQYADTIVQEDMIANLDQTLSVIAIELQEQENKFHTLDALLTNQNVLAEMQPQGRPAEKGWVSSRFGKRTDPFTGKQEYHRGIDFAGQRGSNVVAVAGGVITQAKDSSGYGNLVEIDHGNGYVTRYGHNQDMQVKVGEAVKKGQVVAKMGSTGRSTGPHVHFEVLKNGVHVDPMKFVKSK